MKKIEHYDVLAFFASTWVPFSFQTILDKEKQSKLKNIYILHRSERKKVIRPKKK